MSLPPGTAYSITTHSLHRPSSPTRVAPPSLVSPDIIPRPAAHRRRFPAFVIGPTLHFHPSTTYYYITTTIAIRHVAPHTFANCRGSQALPGTNTTLQAWIRADQAARPHQGTRFRATSLTTGLDRSPVLWRFPWAQGLAQERLQTAYSYNPVYVLDELPQGQQIADSNSIR